MRSPGVRRVFAGRLPVVVLVVAVSAALYLVPSPSDRAADADRAALSGEVSELRADLAATAEQLAATERALAAETAARLEAETSVAGLVADLEAAGAAHYESIVAAFADAASVACGSELGEAPIGDASELARLAAECNASELAIIAGELDSQPRVCGVVPLTSAEGRDLDECVLLYAHSNQVLVDELIVTDWAGKGFTDVLATPVPVSAGDTLDVSGYFRVTNELTANVGVAGHLWAYDIDGDRSVQWRIGPATGDNVDRARHHLPITLDTVYTVPPTWPEGHRMMIVMKADAHSTATTGLLQVDDNGNLIVRITRA